MMRDFVAADQSDYEGLTRRLRGVQEAGLRVGALRAELAVLDAERLRTLVGEALSAVVDGDPAGQDVLAALGHALESSEWDGLRARAALCAHLRGAPLVATYLVPVGHGAPDDDLPNTAPDFGVGRPLTLGERKSVARGRDPNLIARVLRDPDPAVIAILLGNPALVEAQVVRLAARRPVRGAVLREIFRSLRWSTRHAVQLALIQNPWCPIEVGVRLAPLLTLAERRAVARSPEVPAPVRGLCAQLSSRPL